MLKKGALLLASAFILCAASACGGGNNTPKQPVGADLPEVRFSSFYTVEKSGSCTVKMRVPFTDTYTVKFSDKYVSRVVLRSEADATLVDTAEEFEISLTEGQLVYADVTTVNGKVRLNITAKEHQSQLPFELGDLPDAASFSTQSANPSADPLTAATVNYKKRDDTLYVYCNAPEALLEKPEVINHCITRQDVSDQSVYFTFEQQSDKLGRSVFYGYRVRNTGTDDMYVTLKNIGFQRAGSGSYHGEQEWTHFYNTQFKLPDMSVLNESQMANWKAFFNFAGNYITLNYQPVTYRVPAGEYIYVLGGTTEDAYGNFNVGNTANLAVNGNCQNGAVLFDVVGQAEGAYYVYDDYHKVLPGTEGGDDHLGITDSKYGAVHTGHDVGYVVDNQSVWTFNDATPAQQLPVTFTNYYSDEIQAQLAEKIVPTGAIGEKIPSTEHVQNRTNWITNMNVQTTPEAVGTDMTSFHTKGPDGQDIIVGCDWFDTRGKLANLGNWMKDYQEGYTFVNQGDTERELTVSVLATGAIVAFVRNPDGSMVPGTEKYYFTYGETGYGEKLDLGFRYTVKVPAHSVKQFVVEYNLMANSYGYVNHFVTLA
ncbi:MAG: hypothetical protein K2N84_04075 [Clostridia bacterium]|nr:hypothetical protein [Clostridia bacterium]